MNDNKIKGKIIFFSDIDETLVNTDKTLCPENRDALDRFLADGNLFAICTGRALSGASNLLRELGFYGRENVLICGYNGGLIYDTFSGEELLRETIPTDLMYEAFDLAREFGIHIHTYTDTAVVSESDNEHLRTYLSVQDLPVIYTDNIRNLQIAPPAKLLCLDFRDPERITQFRAYFNEHMEGRLACFQSNPCLLEIMPPGIDKGTALKYLAQKKNIPISNTVSAGDEENDIPMILAAGIGCAMANAKDEVKKAADYVTVHDNNHGGVAEILHRFCL